MSHFLSFIIPCYNCADTVGEAIESIYQQNLDIPFEVVCTDDGSEDSTREVLSYYQNKHSNLNVHHHDQNRGGAVARNTCVANSRGDLIFCLDSDNILVLDLVSNLIKLLDDIGCDGASFAELRYFEGTKGNYKHTHSWFFEAPDGFCDINHIMSTTKTPAASGNYLYTRKSYDRAAGYPEGRGAMDSWGFGFRQHATGMKIAILPGSFYWHRLSGESYWTREEKKGTNNKNAAEIVREFPELFTDETNSFLASPDCEKDFFTHIENGRFKTVPEQSLTYLFQGYREQHDRKYSEAVNSFSRAISSGCKHWKVVWCLSQAAYNAGNMNLAKQAAEAVMELAPNFAEATDFLQQLEYKPTSDVIESSPEKFYEENLVCPESMKDLTVANQTITTSNGKTYRFENGIPCFLPSSVLTEHQKSELQNLEVYIQGIMNNSNPHYSPEKPFIHPKCNWDWSKKWLNSKTVHSKTKIVCIGGAFADDLPHVYSDYKFNIDHLANEYCKRLPEMLKANTHHIACTSEKMPFRNGYADLVYARNSLDHVCNPVQTLKEIYRILRPGGKLLIGGYFNSTFIDEHESSVIDDEFIDRCVKPMFEIEYRFIHDSSKKDRIFGGEKTGFGYIVCRKLAHRDLSFTQEQIQASGNILSNFHSALYCEARSKLELARDKYSHLLKIPPVLATDVWRMIYSLIRFFGMTDHGKFNDLKRIIVNLLEHNPFWEEILNRTTRDYAIAISNDLIENNLANYIKILDVPDIIEGWRILWYLAMATHKIGRISVSERLAASVINHAPHFTEAKDFLQQIGYKPEQQTKPKINRTEDNQVKMINYDTDILKQIKEFALWNEGKPLRLHLGCGQRYFDGYINIDYPPSKHTVQTSSVADVFGDITRLDFPQQSVDEVRIHHVFEHFSREASLAMLIKWHKWLKIGGKICIETPDFEASIKLLCEQEYSYEQKQSVLRHIFGSHEADWAIHKDGWYREKFQHVLSALGFEDINFSHSSWQTTRNITVTANKQQHTNIECLREIAKVLLRNDMIDESESEEKLWSIWCEYFDQFFNEAHLGTIPTVSIFMPVYNSQKYLAETIESILRQTYKNFELIIADDGSTDRTFEVAKGYQQLDNRIKVINLPHKGEVHARNEALKYVNPNSKYLLNHDSDDISLPTKLERLVKYLEEHQEIDIVGCFAEYFDDLGNCKGQPAIEYEPNRIRQTFGSVNSMINSASLVRRKVFNKIGNYCEEFRSVDDYDFFARALMAGFELANIPEVLHRIRLHPESVGSMRAQTQNILADKIRDNYESNTNIVNDRNKVLLEQESSFEEKTDSQKEKVNGKELKLHLGCGNIKIPGFINVDIDPNAPAVDVVDDVGTLGRFNNNSASLIYACHVLEHFSHNEIIPILKRWLEILEPGGELRISVPDIDRIVKVYNNNWQHFQTPPNSPWIGLIYGGQNDKYDYHKTGFNFIYLKYLMEQAGFMNISEYPHEPHWLGIKDASLANEPFKEYLSLNISAMKVKSANVNRQCHRPRKSFHILHTVELYNPHVGGAEWVVQQLSERLVNRGHNVTVATTKLSERIFDQLNGVQIKQFDIWGNIARGFTGSDIDLYQQFLLDHPADIMMNYAAQQWATDLAFDTLASTSSRRVNIIAPCGYSALCDSKSLQNPQFADYFNKVIPTILPKYDAAVYHSGQYQDYEFAQNHGFKNSIIIPNGVCEEEFLQPPKLSFRQKFNVTTKYMGLCVANFYKGKGQDKIIECLRQMNRSDFTMVFIGKEGGELNNLYKSASGLNVRFCVGIEREETLAAYHEADIFLFGSKKECSPLVIVEAKASRTPFVSTDCGNVREWKGGIVCLLEKMAFYANKILDEEVIRKNLAEDGYKEWKEKLTWESVINRYEQLYSRLYFKKFGPRSVSIFNPLQVKQLQHT